MEARIVVIDNDKSIRNLFTLYLKKEGWQVLSYPYADVDLDALKQHNPDLIILDFNVGDGGIGWKFLQLLKMEDMTANIPILITASAYHLSSEIRDYLWDRHINLIPKPFDIALFSKIVQTILMLSGQAADSLSGQRALPILVVDDTEELRDALTTILRLEGYQVITASNGLDALNAVSHTEHSLILLDIAMPIMNGYEFLTTYDQQLKPHTSVIIVSGESDIRKRVLPAFVVDVLTKPYEIKQLLKLVKKHIQPLEVTADASPDASDLPEGETTDE